MLRTLLAVAGVAGVVSLTLAHTCRGENMVKALSDDDVVAKVNGTVIRRRAVKELVQGMIAVADKEPDAATVQGYAKDGLESLIDLELLYQESQKKGVVVADSAVDDEIRRTKSHFKSAKEFEQALKAKGLTEAELRRDTRKTMAVNRFLEGSIWKDVQVNAAEVGDFYEHQRNEFQHPADVRASHILIRVPEKATPQQRQEAKARAEELLAKLKGGADFATLARENSQDPGSANRGGDLGYFSKGDMEEEFEKQAMALGAGQLSGVVATSYGFHIIKITDKREAGIEPLDAVQDRIRAVLLKSERQKRQAVLTAELRKQAKLEYGEPL
ncbi:MAG: peptidylprolyl isomerase [Deltaproteobacteria bacterium]|nr:peptidylprolyl isomerase [Deltaproteobacteria bacterium]